MSRRKKLEFVRKLVGSVTGPRSGSVIPEADPRIRIRIRIKMKRIRNTGISNLLQVQKGLIYFESGVTFDGI